MPQVMDTATLSERGQHREDAVEAPGPGREGARLPLEALEGRGKNVPSRRRPAAPARTRSGHARGEGQADEAGQPREQQRLLGRTTTAASARPRSGVPPSARAGAAEKSEPSAGGEQQRGQHHRQGVVRVAQEEAELLEQRHLDGQVARGRCTAK